MVATPPKRGSDQRAQHMQVDNFTETAISNFAAVLAAREKCSRMRSLADQRWRLATILRKHPNAQPEAIESIAYDAVGLG